MSFEGKVVIVTGASSGIGAAIAIKFAAEGANVVLVGRNQTKLKSVFEKCHHKEKSLVITADVSNDEDATKIINETIKHYGKLDVLVNNAGMGIITSILDPNMMEKFDKVMATNLRSIAKITNLAASHLIKTKGSIINMSSITSLSTMAPKMIPYCTSKAGLDHFTRCVALELASKGVRVNSINPGPVITDAPDTMGITGAQKQDFYDSIKKTTALGRVSDPEEIADIAFFLASDKAKSMTGSVYVTDNGALLSGPMSSSILE